MDAAWKVLDTLEDVDGGVNAAYHGVAADYYKVGSWLFGLFCMTQCFVLQAKAEYAPYYRHSLLYLACVDLEKEMSAEEKLIRAHDLAVSAFLADTIHNFGELVCRYYIQSDVVYERADIWTTQLMHPILDAFNGTPHEWIKKLLFTFNEGSIGKFEALAPLFPREVSTFAESFYHITDTSVKWWWFPVIIVML